MSASPEAEGAKWKMLIPIWYNHPKKANPFSNTYQMQAI